VGIENNDDWDFKQLRVTRRNARLVKRNRRALGGIRIAPLKAPSPCLDQADIPIAWLIEQTVVSN